MVLISVKTDARRKNTDDDGATVKLKSSVGRSLFMLIMIYISVERNDMQGANHVLGSTAVRRAL